jgi:hypothetical protein
METGMKIEQAKVEKMTITGAKSLDPITVYAEDIGPRQGKITIECYGKSWSAYWGGCGDKGVAAFFRSCNEDYIANCLDRGIEASIVDADSIKDGALRHVITLRRGQLIKSFRVPGQLVRHGRDEITSDKARKLWEEIDYAEFGDDGWREPKLLQKIFGDEWWYRLPAKPNPDYVYLCRIVRAVQQAFAAASLPLADAAA